MEALTKLGVAVGARCGDADARQPARQPRAARAQLRAVLPERK